MFETLNTIDKFAPITLLEADRVKLMNRIDTKFIFPAQRLSEFIEAIHGNYQILEIDNFRLMPYKSVYFDTQDKQMLTTHHNGKLNRYKIRKREYVISNRSFLEIKTKTNKGRTIKERVVRTHQGLEFSASEKVFISKTAPYKEENLKPVLWNQFNRMTFVHKYKNERLTVDVACMPA